MSSVKVDPDIINNIGKLIVAGVLAPVLGLIGSKLKELFEARDVRLESKRLMMEVTDLLAFTETLQKAANSGTGLAAVPSESLAALQAAIAERIQLAVTRISPPAAVRIAERHHARDLLERLFLLHRPLVWWGWPLHALYYALLGILGMTAALIIADFRAHRPDRWAGVLGVFVIIIIPLIVLNLLATFIDRRKARRMAAADPANQLAKELP